MERICECHGQVFDSSVGRWRHEYEELVDQENQEVAEMERIEENLKGMEKEFTESVLMRKQKEAKWEAEYLAMLDLQEEVDTLEDQIGEAERKLVGHLMGMSEDPSQRQAA